MGYPFVLGPQCSGLAAPEVATALVRAENLDRLMARKKKAKRSASI